MSDPKKPPSQEPPQEPPEDSIPLRIVVFLMALICVVASSVFVHISWPLILLFLTFVVAGSFLSYQHRHDKLRWMGWVAAVGIILTGGLTLYQLTGELHDEFDFVSPFVLFLAGVFTFLTFEMRTRSDLNVSSSIGLLLLCAAAPVAKGLPFGICAFCYVTLGAIMLYFDCVSRTLNAWLDRPINAAPEIPVPGRRFRYRSRAGTTIGLLASIPVLAALMFLMIPRVDELVDRIMAYSRSFDPNYAIDVVLPAKPPAMRHDRGQRGREWFKKNTNLISTLENRERQKKKEHHASDNEDMAKVPPTHAKKGKAQQKAPPVVSKKEKDEKKRKEKSREDERGAHGKRLDQPNTHSKGAPQSGGEKAEPPQKNESKGKKSKKGEIKKGKSVDSGRTSKPGSNEKGNENAGVGEGAGKGNSNGSGKAKGVAGEEGEQGASGAQSDSVAGSNEVAGSNSGSNSGSGGGGNGGGHPGPDTTGAFALLGDEKLDLSKSEIDSDALIMEVKSRRLAYMRRMCFDKFDGRYWDVSDEAKKESRPVEVIDGKVKRSPQPLKVKVPAARTPIAGVPGRNASGRNVPPPPTTNILMKAQKIPDAGSNSQITFGNSAPQAAPAATVEESSAPDPLEVIPDKPRRFVFDSSEQSRFNVGLADALRVPERYPSVDLIQSVTVKAVTIGNVVPGAWIPQELILKQPRVTVDSMGTIKAGAELKAESTFKIKTQLPIYDLPLMRTMPPMNGAEEEEVRDDYSQYLQLPDTVSDDLFVIAEEHSDPRYNWFVQSEQIADYLRKNYRYNPYREANSETQDFVQDFLRNRNEGTSLEFSSAFVMLNRCIGIPTRLVHGFTPGEWNAVRGVREVRGGNIGTWAEAYIPKFGWVAFDPLPEGFLPAQRREQVYHIDEVKKDLGIDTVKEVVAEKRNILGYVLGALAAILALIVLIVVGRKLYRILRDWLLNRARRGPEWAQYQKVLKAVRRSTQVDREPWQTPSEYVRNVREIVDKDIKEGKRAAQNVPDALSTFMDLYTEVYFGSRAEKLEDLKYHADQVVKAGKGRQDRGGDDSADDALRRRS
ncbi:MAG: DUF3488 and transglutaminase-like domain-containing protein [Candidatus Obscuribacterales bacterium]